MQATRDMEQPTKQAARPLVSVVIKCLNEEATLETCIRSVLSAVQGITAEIILADSISTDRSVEIAEGYPVCIVQLTDPSDRRCGAAAQLGYQHVRGRYLLLIDGDMTLLPGFLPAALAALESDARLAAVGGTLVEMSKGIEFQERQSRLKRSRTRPLACITGCGLYRVEAIADVGYFMNRNLHCFEEYELGVRLRARGWTLRMLPTPCVRHYGHSDSASALLARRWRVRFFHGYGELLRTAWLTPLFPELVKPCLIALTVIGWWSVLALDAVAGAIWPVLWYALVPLMVLPIVALLLRKRSVKRAIYAFVTWQHAAMALIAGLSSPQINPRAPLAMKILKA
jgi:glycosyltransferase involved in cell wall biosynthesis